MTFLFLFLLNFQVYSLENNLDQAEISERARLKSYPGGVDEEDLKVQESLALPASTFNKLKLQNKYLQDGSTSDESAHDTYEGTEVEE